MSYQYEFTPQSRKEFRKLSADVSKRIAKKLAFFLTVPDLLSFAEHLTNPESGEYRFRIGDYRVIFDVEGEKIVILKVGHRREIYK